MQVDAHHHFWDLSRGDYEWLTPEMTSLYYDYGPQDLEAHILAHDISATVLVQAAPSYAETQYLLGIAERVEWVKAVVGWVDFEAPDAAEKIQEVAQHNLLKGLRPMVQSFPDVTWMLWTKLEPAFRAMAKSDLSLDALVQPRHLDVLCMFVKRYPDLQIVIDHGAKPKIASGEYGEWARKIARLAEHDHVYCKLSGLWSEAGGSISKETIAPYAEHLLDCFGAKRLMWGSDWPVLNAAGDYEGWFKQSKALLGKLSVSERADVMGKTARRFYAL